MSKSPKKPLQELRDANPISIQPSSRIAPSQQAPIHVCFKTFGCRTNLYDTEIMREHLKDAILTSEQDASIIIVNSCTVTNGADASVRSYVRKVKNLGKKVIFAGCGVKTQAAALYKHNLIDGVLGHSHKEHITEALHALARGEKIFYDDTLTHTDSTIISEFVGKSRAFIKIQEGCNFACSYCIIPSVRGKARSLPMAHILKQVRVLIDAGVEEIVLTGTNVGSYGRDINSSLATLLKALCEIDALKRIRIGSLEPSHIDEALFSMLQHPTLERHLHIALQHTHNTMLTLMNRINRVESDYELLHKIASLGYAIGTDYIVGHPGESEVIWEEAWKNFCALPLTHIHPFIYSVRTGTPSAALASTLPHIKGDIAKARLHALSAHIAASNYHFRKQKQASNTPLTVLVEKQLGNSLIGLDEYFNKIFIESCAPNIASNTCAPHTTHTPLHTYSNAHLHATPPHSSSHSPIQALNKTSSRTPSAHTWLHIAHYEVGKEHNHAYI